MKGFWRFMRFALTFVTIIGVALSLFWVTGGASLSAVALKALGW